MTRAEYLREVGYQLNDLPWGMRRDLLAELGAHLDELPPGTDLRAQLGPPEEYAADLRSAAGLERRRGPIAFLRARRPRNVILIAIALTMIGLAIGAVVWIDSYQPIGFAGSTQDPANARGSAGLDGQLVGVRPGKPFQYGITIRNNGRYSVRVVGVPYESNLPWSARLLMSGPQKGPGMEEPWRPFHSFDMKPGEIRWLVLRGFYTCHGTVNGSVLTLLEFPVRFKFLWRTSTARIGIEPLAFDGKACPAKQ